MANNCYATIQFKGAAEVLAEVKKLLTTTYPHQPTRETLSYDLIATLVPGVRDEKIFEMIGADYSKYILARNNNPNFYTLEEAKLWKEKAKQFIQQQGWLDFRDNYVNERVWEFESKQENDILTIKLSMAWYCPFNFFKYVADKYHLELRYLEKVEGNFTEIGYPDVTTDTYVLKQHEGIHLSDPVYQQATLDLGLFEPVDLVVANICLDNPKAALKLIHQHQVTQEQALNTLYNCLNEDQSFDQWCYGCHIFQKSEKHIGDFSKEELEAKIIAFFEIGLIKKMSSHL